MMSDMEKPKVCTCGGAFKKTSAPENKREGSRYFKCDRCRATIEQTSNGYEFRDAPAPLPVAPIPPIAPVASPPMRPRAW